MKIQENINKLMIAIRIRGKKIKLLNRTYYSDYKEDYVTQYILSEKVKYKDKNKKINEKWIEIDRCWSKVDLLKLLVSYYKEIEGEDDGK